MTHEEYQQYLGYVEKHGSREQVVAATLGAAGTYATASAKEIAKIEAAGAVGVVAAAPVAIAGGGAVAAGAVGGGTTGFVSGLLDQVSATEVAVRTAAGAALGAAIGWAAQKVGAACRARRPRADLPPGISKGNRRRGSRPSSKAARWRASVRPLPRSCAMAPPLAIQPRARRRGWRAGRRSSGRSCAPDSGVASRGSLGAASERARRVLGHRAVTARGVPARSGAVISVREREGRSRGGRRRRSGRSLSRGHAGNDRVAVGRSGC